MDRRTFLKGSGGLLVSFTLPNRASTALAQSVTAVDAAGQTVTKASTAKGEVDAWLAIGPDGRVTVYSGKVDLGTGARTALAQMVAEELDVSFRQVDMIMGDTLLTLDQGQTAGSLTIQDGGATLRRAAACARRAMVGKAAAQWSVDADSLITADGVIATAGGDRRIGYGELVAGKPLQVALDPKVPLKPPAQHKVVGKNVKRVDIPGKVTGQFTFMQDFRLPGMLHARVIRPAGPGAKLVSVDETSIRALPGVRIVRKQDFLAVLSPSEWGAIKAARLLKVEWNDPTHFPDQANLYAYWRRLPVSNVETAASRGDAAAALASAAQRLEATYEFPPHTHGSIGPACAVADFRDGQCTIWSAAQSTHSLQGEIALTLGLDKAKVRLIYLDGAGCYGRNGHEDCSADAALVSQLAGAPVRVQWMRADEHGWDPKSPPTAIDLKGGLDAQKRPVAWQSEFFVATQKGSIAEFPLLATVTSGIQRPAYVTGNISKNADVLYTLPNVSTKVYRLTDSAFRTAHLRSPGRLQNAFANEAFFDELAMAAGADPLQWRLDYLPDPRARAVLEDVAKLSGWDARAARAIRRKGDPRDVVRGRGLAFVRYDNDRTYVATVLEVAVNRKDGHVRVTDVWCSHDCGQIINPDGTRNQIEGGIVQTVSRVMMEELHFDTHRVTSVDWASYPILRFPDVPNIHISLIDRPEATPWGAGEMAPATIPGAISNAVFAAVGVRLRSVPFLPEKVLAGLKGAERGKGKPAKVAQAAEVATEAAT
ncbi:molybdopterin cofactor-binding domain-containing protein [Cupriavidus pauculus]|uniref:xanthine dehydrogenase family protein molybdopterin-binding subunit n=1 Tax=Cupriavidus pauculus TaxID=82633 RepID=UPI001EE1C020|nr:molybdopterin cofactor-binding domain-containing protein [Cupriavidus pauculus]GJG97866.1 xanthine dehydrogenase family protein molybdopterin-binding subunit [Cupriavidus pauculus]